MTRKQRKSKNENAALPVEPLPDDAGLTEPAPVQREEAPAVVDSARDASDADVYAGSISTEESRTAQMDPPEEILKAVEPEESSDDALDEIRRSLLEEEKRKDDQKSNTWWRQIARGLQKDKNVEAVTPGDSESDVPTDPGIVATAAGEQEKTEPENFGDEIDGLIEALKISEDEPSETEATAEAAPREPSETVDFEDLKKQAFQPRLEGARNEATDEVRSIALQGGEEVLVQVQASPQNPFDERLAGIENALRPYRRYIYMGFAVLGALMVAIAAIVLFAIYQRLKPPEPVVEENLPYPAMMILPGGLNFNLERGTLKNGQWNPGGPEWLEGTEICRWIAIPWSRQMEAVIRTLNSNDPIELTMSNNDRLVYHVYSVHEVRFDELQSLETDSPCLLLVLAKSDTDMRWVLTALP